MTFTTDIREAFAELGENFPGFEEILTQALFALVTQEHMLWYSKPGRAKSMVARSIFELFHDADRFSIQLTRDMRPDELFGDIIPNVFMETGSKEYNLDGGIVKCQFSYLDEFFDAPDNVLRALLNVLNEREFHTKDMGVVPAHLHSAIMTTNFMRQREATEAVQDRILCKAVIAGVTDVTDCMRAARTYLGFAGKRPGSSKQLSYGDLLQLSDVVQSPDGIFISPGMRLLHVLLVQEFQRRRYEAARKAWHDDPANKDAADEPTDEELGIPEVTPRTLVKLHDFSRAASALNDRTEVNPEDHRSLGYGLYAVGDASSSDYDTWHILCDEFLGLGGKYLRALDELGEIADGVGEIKAQRNQATDIQLMLGGQLVAATALDIRGVLDRISGVSKHPVLKQAKDIIGQEIDALSNRPKHGTVDLHKGW